MLISANLGYSKKWWKLLKNASISKQDPLFSCCAYVISTLFMRRRSIILKCASWAARFWVSISSFRFCFKISQEKKNKQRFYGPCHEHRNSLAIVVECILTTHFSYFFRWMLRKTRLKDGVILISNTHPKMLKKKHNNKRQNVQRSKTRVNMIKTVKKNV